MTRDAIKTCLERWTSQQFDTAVTQWSDGSSGRHTKERLPRRPGWPNYDAGSSCFLGTRSLGRFGVSSQASKQDELVFLKRFGCLEVRRGKVGLRMSLLPFDKHSVSRLLQEAAPCCELGVEIKVAMSTRPWARPRPPSASSLRDVAFGRV